MLSRKVIIGLTTAVVIVVILGSLFIHSQLHPKSPSNGQNTQQQTSPAPALRAILRVNGYVYSGYWTRDTTTDLPNFVSNVKYSVSNIGNINAVNVSITIYIDGKTYSSNLLPLLTFSEVHYSSFSVSTVYDLTENVLIQASCKDSIGSYTLSVGSKIPRYWTEDSNILKLYVTPKEANVVSIKNVILKNKFPLTPNWIALKDWVSSNIKYPPDDIDGDGDPDYDYINHGEWEYYQLPKETLQIRTGDCEDYAILLVSLLRADGWSPNDVYVVFGKNSEGKGHAWAKIKVNLVLVSVWYNLEPQVGGWNIFDIALDTWYCSGYQAEFYFNDSQFHTVG
jgi:hypothetical protein